MFPYHTTPYPTNTTQYHTILCHNTLPRCKSYGVRRLLGVCRRRQSMTAGTSYIRLVKGEGMSVTKALPYCYPAHSPYLPKPNLYTNSYSSSYPYLFLHPIATSTSTLPYPLITSTRSTACEAHPCGGIRARCVAGGHRAAQSPSGGVLDTYRRATRSHSRLSAQVLG